MRFLRCFGFHLFVLLFFPVNAKKGKIVGLQGKTYFITGASRGIGREIALKLASDGANIVLAAKTAEPHPKLEGTIHSVAEEVEKAGGKALPIQLDIRDEDAVHAAAKQAADEFGSIDGLGFDFGPRARWPAV